MKKIVLTIILAAWLLGACGTDNPTLPPPPTATAGVSSSSGIGGLTPYPISTLPPGTIKTIVAARTLTAEAPTPTPTMTVHLPPPQPTYTPDATYTPQPTYTPESHHLPCTPGAG